MNRRTMIKSTAATLAAAAVPTASGVIAATTPLRDIGAAGDFEWDWRTERLHAAVARRALQMVAWSGRRIAPYGYVDVLPYEGEDLAGEGSRHAYTLYTNRIVGESRTAIHAVVTHGHVVEVSALGGAILMGMMEIRRADSAPLSSPSGGVQRLVYSIRS